MTNKPTEPSPEVSQEDTVCGVVAGANRLVPGVRCTRKKGHPEKFHVGGDYYWIDLPEEATPRPSPEVKQEETELCHACGGSGKADNCDDCEECLGTGQHMRPLATTAYTLERSHTCHKCEHSNIPCGPSPEVAPMQRVTFQSAVSGLIYANPDAAGGISTIYVDGKPYRTVAPVEYDHSGEAIEPVMAPRETQMEPNWLPIPNEQAWWWHFNGESYTIPHIYSVLVSNTGTPRYFIQYPDSRWCDEVGGWWLKVEYPNVPSREFQESARARLENGGR